MMVCIALLLGLLFLLKSVDGDSTAWDLSEVLGSKAVVQEKDMKKSVPPSAPPVFAKEDKCFKGGDVSDALASITCSVELGEWVVSKQSASYRNTGCLIGSHWDGRDRCSGPITAPKETAVSKSPAPRDSFSKEYKRLAEKAEEIVPKTWWREGFANDLLLLSHNDKEGPLRLFNINVKLRNKKLRNINQCLTRQNFIRKPYSFEEIITPPDVGEGGEASAQFDVTVRRLAGKKGGRKTKACPAFKESVVQAFLKLWLQDKGMLGGGWRKRAAKSGAVQEGSNESSGERIDPNVWEWVPRSHNDGELLMAAMEVLEYFFMNYGGIWTGCFRLMDNSDCRGALAAAALTSATHILYDVGTRQQRDAKGDIARLLVEGYLLAGVGRALLHGDSDTTGDRPVTAFNVRLADFTALQQAFLKLYIDSFGAVYTQQLEDSLPLAFHPGILGVPIKQRWSRLITKPSLRFEPIYSHVRNWMFTEANNLIDFGPYRAFAAIPDVQKDLLNYNGKGRRVLIDVGANGFFASPKYLIDSYAPYAPFTDVIMIEPEPHFKATIPEVYQQRYNLTNLPIYAEVNTGGASDVVNLLKSLVSPEDFVVLKFDVDPNKFAYGATMEWGFLFDLFRKSEHGDNDGAAALVDELYVELHFHYPKLYWEHYHSNWEALDLLRSLRVQGMVVHAWP